MTMIEGFYRDMPFEDYAKVEAINYSSLKHMQRSPLSYWWSLNNPQPPTPAMILGSATHRVILEPDRVGDFAVWTGGRRQSKAWDIFCEENADKLIVNSEERDAMVGMAVAVRKNKLAAEYLSDGTAEQSMFWVDRATKRMMKGRPDYIPRERHEIIDLKTTRDCRPFRFGNEAYRLGYHIQLAMYRNGYYYLNGELPDVKIIAVESKAPHETVVFNVPEDVLSQGSDDYMRLLKQVLDCEKAGEWPAAEEQEIDLTLPSYAYPGDLGDDLSDLQLIAQ